MLGGARRVTHGRPHALHAGWNSRINSRHHAAQSQLTQASGNNPRAGVSCVPLRISPVSFESPLRE